MNASVIKSVAKSVNTIKLGIERGDIETCHAAYRFARQYNVDLPKAPTCLGIYGLVVKVLETRLASARMKLAEQKRLLG